MVAHDTIEIHDLPVIDLNEYLLHGEKASLECDKVGKCLREMGVLVVRDPRVSEEDNNVFLNMMERYFEQTDFIEDAREEYSYQVGVTPELKERPRNHCSRAETLSDENKPVTLCPPELDKKSRFFWRIGERPQQTQFGELNAAPVVPENFPEWEKIMEMWGNKMLATLHKVAEMAALAFRLEKDAFRSRMQYGPHLLAPTGSNFYKHNQLNTVLAGYHYDLNLLTIHGKSRFPGLYIWLRDGRKVLVRVPDGCLLVQAGKQIEYLTGGYIQAGFHEVIVSHETLSVIEKKKLNNESLWRVSSTLFSHTASDVILEPLGVFKTEEASIKYPSILAGNQVRKELSDIELGKGFTLNRE